MRARYSWLASAADGLRVAAPAGLPRPAGLGPPAGAHGGKPDRYPVERQGVPAASGAGASARLQDSRGLLHLAEQPGLTVDDHERTDAP